MKRFLAAIAVLALCAGGVRAQDRDAVLDSLQYTGFRYFWDTANPANGLVPDRSTPNSVCSIAATGFGLSAICVGVDHGWVTRPAARQRVLTTLNTFWNGPQGPQPSGVIGYRGLYYHWLDMYAATRRVDWNSELSTIDTALLFAGMLDARQFFSDPVDPDEAQIRALADTILHRAEWDWTRDGGQGIRMGWDPEDAANLGNGFANFGRWVGYNEAMIMYLLAIGSPTHPAPGSDWAYWCSTYSWSQYVAAVGPYVRFAPLFGHQYSHCWVDFRYVQDEYMRTKGITYFENSRRATRSQIVFARTNGILEQILGGSNPSYRLGESDSLWGFTASDDPTGYAAHGAPGPGNFDNGTISPTAAISSIPFEPDSVWPCIRNMWNRRNQVVGGRIYPYWGPYGFGDAFNPEKYLWFTTAVLGIDQGPIVLMIENYRTQALWNRCILNPDLERGLQRAGFTPTALDAGGLPLPVRLELAAEPNPFHASTRLRFRLARAGEARLEVFDLSGRRVAAPVDGWRAAGEHAVTLEGSGLAAGVYLVRLRAGGETVVRRAVLLR